MVIPVCGPQSWRFPVRVPGTWVAVDKKKSARPECWPLVRLAFRGRLPGIDLESSYGRRRRDTSTSRIMSM